VSLEGKQYPPLAGVARSAGVDLQEKGRLSSSVLVYLSKGFGYALV
jgi:hypothetical protein